jgi:hypothetical protein
MRIFNQHMVNEFRYLLIDVQMQIEKGLRLDYSLSTSMFS